jgi:hypothetical protein
MRILECQLNFRPDRLSLRRRRQRRSDYRFGWRGGEMRIRSEQCFRVDELNAGGVE